MTKWMTSGASRLKANLNRSFGARKNKKAAAHCRGKSYDTVVASAKNGERRKNSNALRNTKKSGHSNSGGTSSKQEAKPRSTTRDQQDRNSRDSKRRKMNGLPSDFGGSRGGGRMLSHPRFDRSNNTSANGVMDNMGADSSSAFMNFRGSFSNNNNNGSSSGSTVNPLLLQQELRRQHLLGSTNSGGGFGSTAITTGGGGGPMGQIARRGEQELLRIQGEHNELMEAEIAVRAMRDRLTQKQGGGERSPPKKRDDTFHSESIDRIVALQEEQAVRQREIDRLKQAEQARIFGGISLGGGGASTASAPMSTSNNNFNQFSQTSTSNTLGGNSGGGSMNQAVLAEEMAIRERLHRRMMEEEADAIKQQNFRQHRAHQHKNSMVVAEREHLNRLLQLQQMSDEDLIRRAAEVRASQNVAVRESIERNKTLAVEQQLIEAQLMRNDNTNTAGLSRFQGVGAVGRNDDYQRLGLDMIDQAHADAAVANSMSVGSPLAGVDALGMSQHSVADAMGMSTHSTRSVHDNDLLGMSSHSTRSTAAAMDALAFSQHSVHDNDLGASQHSINSAMMMNRKPQPLRYFNNGVEVDVDGIPLPKKSSSPTSLIQAVQANLQQQRQNSSTSPSSPSLGVDNNIISKFLSVVVSRVPEIAPAVANLLPEGGDPVLLKHGFPLVVNATLSELHIAQERLATSHNPSDADFYRRITNCIEAIEPYKVEEGGGLNMPPVMAAMMGGGGGGGGAKIRQMDPDSCQPLVPNHQMGAPSKKKKSKKTKSSKGNNKGSPKQIGTLPESPIDDMPMMAAHKMKKKKKSKKDKKKEKKRKSLTVSKSSKSSLKGLEEALREHAPEAMPLNDDDTEKEETVEAPKQKTKERIESNVSTTSKERSESNASSIDEPAAKGDEKVLKPGSSLADTPDKCRPMKKRRMSDEVSEEEDDETKGSDDTDDTMPINNIYQKNGQVVSPKRTNKNKGPHGDLLNTLFGDAKKEDKDGQTSTNDDKINEKEDTMEVETTMKESESAYDENAIITDNSEHTNGPSSMNNSVTSAPSRVEQKSEENDEDRLGAASMLLGLLGGSGKNQ